MVADPALRGFLAQVAASRKDVECTFGRLKNRFRCIYPNCNRSIDVFFCRILKTALCVENIADIHKLFMCCCIFHNMLLLVDRPFDDSQPTASEILRTHVSERLFSQDSAASAQLDARGSDHSGVGMEGAPPHVFFQDGRTEPTHYWLRDKLAAHYNIARSVSE
jgi:hypothetical protein